MYTDWKDETECSKSCGFGSESGTKRQKRTKSINEAYGGTCDNVFTQNVKCTSKINCPSEYSLII